MSRFLWIILALIGGGLILLVVNHDSGQTFGLPNDAFAESLYLGIWGIVLAAAILASGMRLGDVARQLAIWTLIILALVAGYQYRYELQDVAYRVTGGLVPGSPLTIREDGGQISVMLDKSRNGHFEARATVDGVPIRLLVDTGATTTVISNADASKVGIDTDSLRFNVPVMTANGPGRAARATADSISVGDITRRRVPILVAEPGRLGQSLLGMNFLGTLSGFDVRGDRLILRD